MRTVETSYTTGENCSLPGGGCTVGLIANSTMMVSTSRYFLVSGSANIAYNGNPVQMISSPYSGNGWQPYVDMWSYNVPTALAVDPTTVFVQIRSVSNTDGVVTLETIKKSELLRLENTTASVDVQPDSSIIVIGKNFSLNGNTYVDRKLVNFVFPTAQNVTLQSSELCWVFYIER